MLALFNSAVWQSNATQRVCCIYLNFIFILFISNLFHFLPLQSIVCRVRRWTSLGSLRLLKKKRKNLLKNFQTATRVDQNIERDTTRGAETSR